MSVQGSKYGQHAGVWYTAKDMDELADHLVKKAKEAEKAARKYAARNGARSLLIGEATGLQRAATIIRATKVES